MSDLNAYNVCDLLFNECNYVCGIKYLVKCVNVE